MLLYAPSSSIEIGLYKIKNINQTKVTMSASIQFEFVDRLETDCENYYFSMFSFLNWR